MQLKRVLFLSGAGFFLLPSIASGASGASTAGCVSVPIAIGLAMLPPEAITDYARESLGQKEKAD